MPDIVISEFMDEAAVADLAASYDVLYAPDLVDRGADLLAALADARALIVRNRTQVRGDVLAAGPGLKVIGRLGVGLDNIDLDACKERGITVCPATGANDDAVAEYVILTAMTLLRGATSGKHAMLSGSWPRGEMMGHEIGGKVLGFIGFGGIARRTRVLAEALGITVHGFDPFLPADNAAWTGVTRHEALASLLGAADIVSLHVPLTEATRHVIDAAAVAAMKPGAILINAARGGTVDEAAVIAGLRSGHLGGAAIDVFETEPLTAEAAVPFKGVPNLILTPHIAGVTVEANTRVSALTAKNVRAVLEAS